MPLYSAARTASSATTSISTSLSASSAAKILRACATVTLRLWRFFGTSFPIMDWRLSLIPSKDEPANILPIGRADSSTSTSMTSFSSSPERSRLRIHSRPA